MSWTAWRRPAAFLNEPDNGTGFTSTTLDDWAYQNGITLVFIQAGKPIEHCIVESFNGRLRDECLNLHWFISLADARPTIEVWRCDYNAERPHSSLGNLPPAVFAKKLAAEKFAA